MKHIYILVLAVLFAGCCSYDYDYSFPNVYNRQLHFMERGDTLIFKSGSDFDTIAWAGMDSTVVCGSVLNSPWKEVKLNVARLPILPRPKDLKYRELCVIVGKESNTYCAIYFRDFHSDINDTISQSATLQLTLDNLSGFGLGADSVMEVGWSLTKGLMSYKLNDGRYYERVAN